MQIKVVSGASLAAAAIALAVSGAALTTQAQAKKAAVHCMGINACKGQGFLLEKSAKACTAKGGTVG